MNNDGRKRIAVIMKDIEGASKAREEIDAMIEELNGKIADYKELFADATTMIEELRDEEQEKFDNLTEGLQASERGQNIEAAVQSLETAYDAANNAADIEDITFEFDADEIITALDEASGY
jgi:F0F1-type ATP synthase membrane subunit b/b'